MATQIEATVLKIGTLPDLTTSQTWSFPTQEIAIEETVSGDINASITWQGTIYYVSETFADLVAAANAGSSYKVYTALLTQSGTDAPVATVLENTIGDIVWVYNGVGVYTGVLLNAFPLAKTWIPQIITVFENIPKTFGRTDDNTVSMDVGDNGVLSYTSIEIRVYP